MNNMVTKLSSVAALLGVVGAIGAGFIQYGKVMAKIEELDKRKVVISKVVDLNPIKDSVSTLEVELIDRIDVVQKQIKPTDLSLVFAEISKVKEQIAMLDIPKAANLNPLNKLIKELENKVSELKQQVAIVSKENELQDILMEEIKAKNSNPLGN